MAEACPSYISIIGIAILALFPIPGLENRPGIAIPNTYSGKHHTERSFLHDASFTDKSRLQHVCRQRKNSSADIVAVLLYE